MERHLTIRDYSELATIQTDKEKYRNVMEKYDIFKNEQFKKRGLMIYQANIYLQKTKSNTLIP